MAEAYNINGKYEKEGKILCIKYYLEDLFGKDQPGNRGFVGEHLLKSPAAG
jgi:hypothetical protein